MKICFLFVVLFLVGCSERSVGYHGSPTAPGTVNNGDVSYYNELIYSRPHGISGPEYKRFNLNFQYTRVQVAVIAGNVYMERDLQIQLYDWNDNLITHYRFDVSGNMTQEFTSDLGVRPAYVVIDAPTFSGDLLVKLNSVH